MAEEIREPGKNLPRALLGSVVTVTVLYSGVILVCLALRPWEALSGPTLVADLAEDLMGPAGRAALLFGAVLATVSSANASIMSASRISFAMGRDSLISEWLNEVHPRTRVPHRAILATGIATLGIVFLGDIELLAEAAGLLHLLLYGLVCVACVILRGARPAAYRPVYRTPFFPLVPVVGALACFAIIFYMQPVIIAMGMGIVAFAVAHFYGWARHRTELRGEWPNFLRRGVLEPALARVEAWGAVPDRIPTAIVAVGHPERERPRLLLAAALMGPTRGNVLMVSVHRLEQQVSDGALRSYYDTIEERNRVLEVESAPIRAAGARVASHVVVASTAFRGLLSAAETSRASLLIGGWPGRGPRSPEEGLVPSLDRYLRTHIILFRDAGPIPARRILAIVDETSHGSLARVVGSRLASAWSAELTVATVMPADADEESRLAEEARLEAELGVSVRADVRAIPASSQEAAVGTEAKWCDLVVVGVSGVGGDLASAVERLEGVKAASLALVRAHPEASLEFRRTT